MRQKQKMYETKRKENAPKQKMYETKRKENAPKTENVRN